MSGCYVKYNHRFGDGKIVPMMVRVGLKGLHSAHCCCYDCELFKPDDRDKNCPKANLLFEVCRTLNLVTPVWECDTMQPKQGCLFELPK
jgi:hypothetical protein